jgi:ABC-2 type transport system ATP-binding protein
VYKRFGEVEALRGLDLELRVGQWVGLLGPNGAGKTTLMRVIAGLTVADQGEFELLGQPIDPTRSARTHKSLGVVPQEIALYPALTATENLRIFARIHGVGKRDLDQRVEWALEWTGVADRADVPVSGFSGGMKRRLNIACGVLHEPRVVLLDEPTVGVDPQARQRIWRMLEGLRESGTSLIHSSHQLDEIETTCDRILIMDHGRVVGQGDLAELVEGVLGSQRRLVVRFNGEPTKGAFGEGFEVGDHQVAGEVDDLARELPEVLAIGLEQGLEVVDVHVDAPSLEDVFTHMTGQELRE